MKKNKGFTLIELLAVIIIIGILSVLSIVAVSRLINKSRDTQLAQQKNTLQMAAESYLQANRVFLPKNIGESTIVKVETLKQFGYLKEDVKNSKGQTCMNNSLVKVTKTSKTKYKYEAFLYCGDDEVPASEVVPEPVIKIDFVDENGKTAVENPNILNDVATARFRISFKGSADKKSAISGYSYTILVDADKPGNLQEVYSSGTLSGNGLYEIEVNKLLKEYIDITTITTVKIKAVAINSDGGIKDDTSVLGDKPENSTAYKDNVKPTCDKSKTLNEATTNKWITKKDVENGKTRKISVYCTDGNGSGCVRDTFTRSWPNDKQKSAVYGYIQVVDNAGNKSVADGYASGEDICNTNYDTKDPCLVKVYVDAVSPTIQVNAYKRNASGNSTGSSVLKNAVTTIGGTGSDSATIKADQYASLNNGWANKSNYPNGIVYTITLKDDIYLASWKWETNKTGISNTSDSNYEKYSVSNPDGVKETTIKDNNSSKVCGALTHSITIGFTGNGKRKGRLTVKDNAGNVTTYYIEFNLDNAAPTCTNSGGSSTWRNTNLTIKGTCKDTGGSGCIGNVTKTYSSDINSTKESPGTVYDNAGNATNCLANQTVKIDKTAPTCTSSGGSSNWTNKSVTITGTCSDKAGGSGCKKTTVTKTFTSNTNTTASPGTVYDNAGNSANCPTNQVVKIDKTAPTCTSSGGSNTWTNKAVTLTGTCSDTGGSGCKNATVTKEYTKATNATSQSPGTVYDNAGNSTKCPGNQTVKYDPTPPTCTNSGGSSSWTNKNITITGTCKDTGGSGCSTSTVTKTYSSNTNSTKETPGTVSDKAGNSTPCKSDRTVKIDKTPPTINITKTSTGELGVSGNIKCSDTGGSGCSSTNTSSFTNIKKSATYTVKDNAGNSSSTQVKITQGTNTYYRQAKTCNYTYDGTCYEYKTTMISAPGHCSYAAIGSNTAGIKLSDGVWYYYNTGSGCSNASGGGECCKLYRSYGCKKTDSQKSGSSCGWYGWEKNSCTPKADVCETKSVATYS